MASLNYMWMLFSLFMMVLSVVDLRTEAQAYGSYASAGRSLSPIRSSYLNRHANRLLRTGLPRPSSVSINKHANALRASTRFPTYGRPGISFSGSSVPNVNEILQAAFGLPSGGGGGGGGDAISTRTSPSRTSCSTPAREQGQCVLLSECPLYVPLITNIRDIEVSLFIRDRICRLEVNNVRICCPNDPQNAVMPPSISTSQGGFLQPQTPSTTKQPVRISFGGSGNNRVPSQSLPVSPTQNRQPPSTVSITQGSRPPSISSQSPFQNTPSLTTTNPRTSSQGVSVNSLFPTTQNLVPTQFPILPPPPRLPIQPPQTLPPQPSTQLGSTQRPQNGVSFAPSSMLPDRMNGDQAQDPSIPANVRVPSAIIPSESECGSSLEIRNFRSNGQLHWPWLVAVGHLKEGGKFEVMCGGAVITSRHVITAAHCLSLNRFGNGIATHVRLGDYDLDRSNDVASPQDVSIEGHQTPGHDSNTFAKDIAIITLSRSIAFNEFIQPVCLPYRFHYDGFRYQSLDVVGWRHTLFIKGQKDLPQTPNHFLAPVLALSECRRKYHQTSKSVIINRKNLCAFGGNENACLRDSSALAVYHDEDTTNNFYLVGVGSFGFGCDQVNEPYVFTRVGAFINWIEEVISNGNSSRTS